MGFIIYLIIAFITFFFADKKINPDLNWGDYRHKPSVVILFGVFWMITIPFYFLWLLLDKLHKKYNK